MPHQQRTDTQGRRIAVIDDDPALVAWATDVLTEHGYQVVSATSRDQAYDLVRRTQPALVLVDIHMEYANSGWVLLSLLQATPALTRIPVLVWSADTRMLDAHARRLAAKGWRWLAKPCALDDLVQQVTAALASAPPLPASAESVAASADAQC